MSLATVAGSFRAQWPARVPESLYYAEPLEETFRRALSRNPQTAGSLLTRDDLLTREPRPALLEY